MAEIALLEVKNVNKSFDGVVAVNDFSMELEKNHIVGLIGPNGAGKTTIFNLISKVYELDSGKIFLCGEDITFKNQKDIARIGIARTFQNIRLFPSLTVLENVKISCDYKPRYSILEDILFLPRRFKGEKAIAKEAQECLELVDLFHMAEEKPNNLPYGMQRRLEIARALALKPKVLMLDEPAAGLIPAEALELIDFLKDIINKLDISLIVIEHRMDVIMQLCDKIYVQNYGRAIAVGTPEQIQVNHAVLTAYLGEENDNA